MTGPLPFPDYLPVGSRLVLTSGLHIRVADVRNGRVYSYYGRSSWPVETIDIAATRAAEEEFGK